MQILLCRWHRGVAIWQNKPLCTKLSELDENKFSKEDILSLVGSGWSKSDIKKLVDDLSDPSEDEEDKPDDSDNSNNHNGNPDKKSEQDDPETDDSDEDESIDYRALYEKEKKLREDLQHSNTLKTVEEKDNRSDEEIAVAYKNIFHTEPRFDAIHAGLECGILSEKIEGLDCVSFGPQNYDIHTPQERLNIASTERVWKFLLEYLKQAK